MMRDWLPCKNGKRPIAQEAEDALIGPPSSATAEDRGPSSTSVLEDVDPDDDEDELSMEEDAEVQTSNDESEE